jgi:hypothetical protein
VDPSSRDPERDSKRQAWINENLFSAKLSTYKIPQLDERHRAGFVMRHTLEKTPWDSPPLSLQTPIDPNDSDYSILVAQREHELELHDIKRLDNWIPAASVWIQINAQGLYEMEGPMNTEREWIVTNWKGKRGWSKERYGFWRERFEVIGDIGELEEKTRELAREAAKIMKSI